MLRIKRLSFVLVLIGIAGLVAYSQETATDYVAPLEAVPRGTAPKMKVQLLNPDEQTKQYAVIFYQGDEAFSGCWSLRRSITLRAPISPLLEHSMGRRSDGSTPNARCTRRFPSRASTK